jgi:hypothetical protein
MTSEDDIKGLVSWKFLRPCPTLFGSRKWFLKFTTSVADPHHFNADPADPDQSNHPYAELDPSFQMKTKTHDKSAPIVSYSIHFGLPSANWCRSGSGLKSLQCGSGSWFLFDADPEAGRISIWCGCKYGFSNIHKTVSTTKMCGMVLALSLNISSIFSLLGGT